jgi:GTPase
VFTAIDTAGVRKTKSLQGDIDFYSQHRALRSVRRADVVLLLIDAALPVSSVDQQLAEEILEHFKPCVLVVNKWDLAREKATQDQYMEYLAKQMAGLNFAPVAFLSAREKDGLHELVEMARDLHTQAGIRVPTSQLNRALEKAMGDKPPTSSIGRKPKVFYLTQADIYPPTITLFVNDPTMFDPSYQRYLMNRFREMLPFAEVPIKLVIREREREEMGEGLRKIRSRQGGAKRQSHRPKDPGRPRKSRRGGR